MNKMAGGRSKANARRRPDGSAEIAGVKLTHSDRVLYPEQGITKLELAEYYEQIADWILPHVSHRLLTLVRCPQGQQKQCFYQRNGDDGIAAEIHRLPLREGKSVKQALTIDSLPGLIALVQMGVLEIHTWGSTTKNIERPDRLTFDFDPAPELPWKIVRNAALELRARLTDLGLSAFVKTTGGKGLHVVAPIVPSASWEDVKDFARAAAEKMVEAKPELYLATMSKTKRAGKIFIDYLRNARMATAICAYSTRARSGAPVSVPLHWDELKSDKRADHFTIRNVPARLRRRSEDPWQDYEAARRPIDSAMRRSVGIA